MKERQLWAVVVVVVIGLAFYYDNSSLNPPEANSFSIKFCV